MATKNNASRSSWSIWCVSHTLIDIDDIFSKGNSRVATRSIAKSTMTIITKQMVSLALMLSHKTQPLSFHVPHGVSKIGDRTWDLETCSQWSSADASVLIARSKTEGTPFVLTIKGKKYGRPTTNFEWEIGRKFSSPFANVSPKTQSTRTMWVEVGVFSTRSGPKTDRRPVWTGPVEFGLGFNPVRQWVRSSVWSWSRPVGPV